MYPNVYDSTSPYRLFPELNASAIWVVDSHYHGAYVPADPCGDCFVTVSSEHDHDLLPVPVPGCRHLGAAFRGAEVAGQRETSSDAVGTVGRLLLGGDELNGLGVG